MIYLATISDRIPIVPPFAPDHHICKSSNSMTSPQRSRNSPAPSAGPLPFGHVFNLTELRRTLRHPVLEWSEVKRVAPRRSTRPPAVEEELGCWSTRSQNEKSPIRAEHLLHHLGLDVSYTRVPNRVRHEPSLAVDAHVSLYPVMEMIYPIDPTENPGDRFIMAASPLGARLGPDTHMACFDFLYFATTGSEKYEWPKPWSPVWRFIGRHLKFTDALTKLSTAYVRRAFNVTIDEELPPVSKGPIYDRFCPQRALVHCGACAAW